jgi:hypothetical protein
MISHEPLELPAGALTAAIEVVERPYLPFRAQVPSDLIYDCGVFPCSSHWSSGTIA